MTAQTDENAYRIGEVAERVGVTTRTIRYYEELGLLGGDIFHGRLELDQLFSARPVLGHGAYRGPLAGLYMCGAGTHPGGGVTGAPGHNAAREILKDLRRSARAARPARAAAGR